MSILYNSDASLESYNASRFSLRESLIPLDEWMEEMFDMECDGPFDVSFKPAQRLLDAPHYIAPYPAHMLPMYIDVLREVGDKTDFDKLYDIWLPNLLRRCASLLMNAISEDDMAAIDDNYDLGVILQRSTGVIIPFDYSKMSGIRIDAMSAFAEYCACSIWNASSDDAEEAKAIQEFLRPNANRYHLEYTFIGSDKSLIKGTSQFPGNIYIEGCDIPSVIAYVNSMYKSHAKVIPVV